MTKVVHSHNKAVCLHGGVFVRVAALLLAALLVLGVFAGMPSRALAVEVNQPDPSAGISLLVKDQHDEEFIEGTQVDVYRIADVADNGQLVPVGTFATLPVSWDVQDQDDARILADTLAAFVARDGIAFTDSVSTNANGVAVFPSEGKRLEPGYYLILASAHQEGAAWHRPLASLVSLPYAYEDGSVDYAPIVSLKHEVYDEPRPLDVFKVWEGENPNQPKNITLQLLRDGQVYDTVVLDESNGWHKRWENLEPEFQWTILEKSVSEGYTIGLDGSTGIVAVTNTYENPPGETPPGDTPPGETPPGDTPPGDTPPGDTPPGDTPSGNTSPGGQLPRTGQLWWPVAALLMAGVVLLGMGLSRKMRK